MQLSALLNIFNTCSKQVNDFLKTRGLQAEEAAKLAAQRDARATRQKLAHMEVSILQRWHIGVPHNHVSLVGLHIQQRGKCGL